MILRRGAACRRWRVLQQRRGCFTSTAGKGIDCGMQAVACALDGPTLVAKGAADSITTRHHGTRTLHPGCPRRCGGQGDVLAGVIATTASWVDCYANPVSFSTVAFLPQVLPA